MVNNIICGLLVVYGIIMSIGFSGAMDKINSQSKQFNAMVNDKYVAVFRRDEYKSRLDECLGKQEIE